MFKFLFKRNPKPAPVVPVAAQAAQDTASAGVEARKQAALNQALALSGNEAGAVAFILQSEFADARLRAAEHVHSKIQLEHVAQAMRNTDRRVVKLVRQRLDAINHQERQEQAARQCIAAADQLVAEQVLIPSQVAELDRSWTAVGTVGEPISNLFLERRSTLQQKLDRQMSLQRRALELRTRLIDLSATIAALPLGASAELADQDLNNLEQEVADCYAADEAASLPKHLAADLAQYSAQARQALNALQQRREALQKYEVMLSEWEAGSVDSYHADTLRRAWRSLPALQAEDANAVNQRFDALIARLPSNSKPVKAKVQADAPAVKLDNAAMLEALDGMEQALADGSLQAASEHAKVLQGVDPKLLKLSGEQLDRLSQARQELARLKGWARWGGNVSREELVKTAEDLPGLESDIGELAKKVGSLRAHWKSMDVSAGPASKELWSRFDAACTAAYAPVAEHFARLAKERKENLERAQALVAEIKAFAESEKLNESASNTDWKKVAGQRMQFIQAWRKIGPIDRKERKAIEAEFNDAMRLLSEPLAAQQKWEIARREELIAQVAQLDPSDRHAVDKIRSLQQEWQQGAKLLPLERADEQALWQRFRAACDNLFEQRKALGQEADAFRQRNLQDKQALCSMLESAGEGPIEAVTPVLADADSKWQAIGPVSREAEQNIDARYQKAVRALQAKLAAAQRATKAEQLLLVRDKLRLCFNAEEKASLIQTCLPGEIQALRDQWHEKDALPTDLEKGMYSRFNAALDAVSAGDGQYAELLKRNQPILERALLRLEVLMEVESPPELAAERLKLQVKALQLSLKTGNPADTPRAVLLELCTTPAWASGENRRRIEYLLENWKH